MNRLWTNRSTYDHVFAVFESSVHSFDMPCGASFADLASRLALMSERYAESLVRIEVTTHVHREARRDAMCKNASSPRLSGMAHGRTVPPVTALPRRDWGAIAPASESPMTGGTA